MPHGQLEPEAAVLVATVRALKLHGGVPKEKLGEPDVAAVTRGFANLRRHLENVARFGVPAVVALNRFRADTAEELGAIRDGCEQLGVRAALCEVWEKGGEGGRELAEALLALLQDRQARFAPTYDAAAPIRQKIEHIATTIYRADGVSYAPAAARAIDRLEKSGLGDTPVCMAKTQYSFTDDPGLLGAPDGFTVNIRDVYPSAGAGFVVALTGDIMTMPGLGKTPAAERMRLSPDGRIEGLF